MTTTDEERPSAALEVVVLGVDTHLDAHVAVALDHHGRRLGALSLPATEKGYGELLSWAQEFGGPLRCAGVEGTSSYGAGLARHLKSRGIEVLEVERPKRRQRSTSRGNRGKSDHADAEAAARIVLAGEAAGVPKSGDGCVEMIRVLRAARRAAVKARTQAANQLKNLVVTAPEGLRGRLRKLSTKALVATAVRFRPGDSPGNPEQATKFALRSVARRYRSLSEEIAELDVQLTRLLEEAAPALVALPGVGKDHAATLLVAAGDNPERLKSEASFASLSLRGLARRSLLGQGREAPAQPYVGNRDANRALHSICVVRMGRDRRTQAYVARRTAEGKSKREIMRCLKRYVAREAYRVLVSSCGACSSLTRP
jgi:transposase